MVIERKIKMFTNDESLALTNLFSDLLDQGYNESDISHELDNVMARLVEARAEETANAKKKAAIQDASDLLYRTLDTYLSLTQPDYQQGYISHFFPETKDLTNYIDTLYTTAAILTRDDFDFSDIFSMLFEKNKTTKS